VEAGKDIVRKGLGGLTSQDNLSILETMGRITRLTYEDFLLAGGLTVPKVNATSIVLCPPAGRKSFLFMGVRDV
jgi:hypothetical protein